MKYTVTVDKYNNYIIKSDPLGYFTWEQAVEHLKALCKTREAIWTDCV